MNIKSENIEAKDTESSKKELEIEISNSKIPHFVSK